MKKFLSTLTLSAAVLFAALHFNQTAAAGPEDQLAIDQTEVVAIDPFTRTMPDGTKLVYDRKLVIEGHGFLATSMWPKVRLGGESAWGVENPDSETITVYLPANAIGPMDLEVQTPTEQATAEVTF
jgi:hypothetical protein